MDNGRNYIEAAPSEYGKYLSQVTTCRGRRHVVSATQLFTIYFIYLFAQKTTIITAVTKVSVHELDKKANKLALTVAHNKPLHK